MELELSPTLEDYLLSIYRIENRRKVARPKDISKEQNVAKSTVTAALQSLSEKGLINYEPYEVITLTEEGKTRAEDIAVRHTIIKRFLQDVLRLDTESAEQTACRMEHAVDQESLERFVCFLAFMRRHSKRGAMWLNDFQNFLTDGAGGQSCRECIAEYVGDVREEGEL
jgi:DtxR family Mn-dependent transcriptional regulator